MKNKITKNLKPLLVAVLLLVGFWFAYASIWTNPTSDPLVENTKPPVDLATKEQEKDGRVEFGSVLSNSIDGDGSFVTIGNFINGAVGWSLNYTPPAVFYGDVNFFSFKNIQSKPTKLCTNQGFLKKCQGNVKFVANQERYETAVNVVSYPSTNKIVGSVFYQIPIGQECTTIGTSGTNWTTGTKLSGTNLNYSVTFDGWGTYNLAMNCGSEKPEVTITVGGRIETVNSGQEYTLNLNLGSTRQATVTAFSAGSPGVDSDKNSECFSLVNGEDSYASIGSTTIFRLGGAKGGVGGVHVTSNSKKTCGSGLAEGGVVLTNNLSNSIIAKGHAGTTAINSGYTYGGCSGIGVSACDQSGYSGTIKSFSDHGKGGSSQAKGPFGLSNRTGNHGYAVAGAGGAYATGSYTLPATGTLKVYAGKSGGSGIGSGPYPSGRDGFVRITW